MIPANGHFQLVRFSRGMPLKACAAPTLDSTGIALLRAHIDACSGRTQKVIQEVLDLLSCNRLVRLDVNIYFSGATSRNLWRIAEKAHSKIADQL